jgi:integrase
MRSLYANGNEARTVYSLISIVQQWLRLHGITGLLQGRDKPKFVANMRNMYERGELESLFQACTPDEKMRYLFFLLTGERDQEVRHTTWSDIDFTRKCVRVTARKQLGFKPKDKEEREIPVAASLFDALLEYKARQTGINRHNLVFPTSEGRPDKKFENKLKKIAYRAGLNCGHCISRHRNKCGEGPYCGQWFLHKFRHTFATTCLEEGVVSARFRNGWDIAIWPQRWCISSMWAARACMKLSTKAPWQNWPRTPSVRSRLPALDCPVNESIFRLRLGVVAIEPTWAAGPEASPRPRGDRGEWRPQCGSKG